MSHNRKWDIDNPNEQIRGANKELRTRLMGIVTQRNSRGGGGLTYTYAHSYTHIFLFHKVASRNDIVWIRYHKKDK
jgi:hypothetical protein